MSKAFKVTLSWSTIIETSDVGDAVSQAKTELIEKKIAELDKKTRAERLNAFDDIGNYALFNKYLEIK